MKRLTITVGIFLSAFMVNAQNVDTLNQNTAEKLLNSDTKLSIGGYGEAHYNQALSSEFRKNGTLDIHRMVMFFAYNYSKKTQFVTEIEFEHISEVYVEQAFLQHKLNKSINFRAGLLLIPMGIVNEYHEPTAFNGVERPTLDNKISPTTWREIGFGFAGTILDASLKYQAYLVNGFNGYDGTAKFSGKNALRNGRQKGAESYISSPNFTGKIEYFRIRGLNIGLSAYYGKSQSKLYNGIDKNDSTALANASSSVVGVSMIGFDTRYNYKGIQLRGQLYYTYLTNTEQYNKFTAVNNVNNDLGNSMAGFYAEVGYNVFHNSEKIKSELIPFFRFEKFDTQFSTDAITTKNDAYNSTILTSGLTYKITKGVVLKADLQLSKSKADTEFSKTFNAGFGVNF